MNQVPGVSRRRAGGLVVTALNDGYLNGSAELMQGVTPSEVASLLTAAFRPPAPRPMINAFLVQGGGRTVLIDTGAGPVMPSSGRLPDNLHAAGVAAADVDLVVLTHLHVDHWGGLARPDGSAAFPKAELAIPAAEAEFWLGESVPAAAQDAAAGAKAAIAPYRGRTRLTGTADVLPGIVPVPLPGHTPGHTGYLLGGELLVWGDIMHVPAIQAPRPEVTLVYDLDPAQAAATRARLLDRLAADRTAVAGMHLDFPGFFHVARAAQGYALVSDAWMPDL